MKTFTHSFIGLIICILSVNNLSAQVIQINQTFSGDTVITPFSGSVPVYSLSFSGGVNLLSDSSLVRVVLIDTYGNHYMVFESYPLITRSNMFDTLGAADETAFLNGVICDSLRIDIINAFLEADSLKPDTAYIPNAPQLQVQAKWENDSVKIDIMNRRIVEEHMYWRAGRSSLQELTFQDKEFLFGSKYNLMGYDYYLGGIFKWISKSVSSPDVSNLTQDFDWRRRHASAQPESPYYNHASPSGTTGYPLGWISPFQEFQQGYTCYAFASIYFAEALSNLYFNNFVGPDSTNENLHQINLDLSQQQIIVCQNQASSCSVPGGASSSIFNYMCTHYIVNEECFPYECPPSVFPCPTTWNNLTDEIMLRGTNFLTTSDIDSLKKILIEYGPISCNITNYPIPNPQFPAMTHQMLLVGFSLPRIGDTVYHGSGSTDPPIVLDEHFSDTNVIQWWFKDSYQNNFISITNITCLDSLQHIIPEQCRYLTDSIVRPLITTPIICSDEDGDGYYWWGLHWKYENGEIVKVSPQECNCPPGVNIDEEDCNDWDKAAGPYDSIYQCTENCLFDSIQTIISVNTQWTSDRHFNGDLIIRGCTLTIWGSTLWMGPDTRIIVERDGKLELKSFIDNGSIRLASVRAACGEFWQGIEVWGTTDSTQEGTGQGILEISGAILQDMKWGIRNFKPNPIIESGIASIGGYSGGIIQASYATFLNNRIDVIFAPYPTDNSISLFDSCLFEINGLLPDQTYPTYKVVLNGINGVEFSECMFKENLPWEPYHTYGIYAYNAGFTFDGGNADPSVPEIRNFSSLNYGIYAISSGANPDYTIQITGSWFDQNRRGIFLSGITGERIRNNLFYIPKIEGDTCYGIYLDHSDQWNMITENVFSSPNPLNSGHVGLYINYCGGEPKEIYKNSFDHLEYGTVAFGVNRSSEGIGLVYRCNGFSNCLNDIVVMDEPEYPDGGIFESCMGIAYYQGDMNAVAANTFTNQNTCTYNIFNGAVNNIRYRLPSDWNIFQEFYPYKINSPVKVYLETGYQSVSEINCDSLPVDTERDVLDNMLQSLNEEIDSLNVELELMVDGGNTQSLNTTVVSSIPPQALQLYDELMLKSPNLSDSVLNSSILKETVLNNAMLRDILVSNPQSAKQDSLMQKLDERLAPMPDTMKAEIREGIHYLSMKEQLEATIQRMKAQERAIFSQLITSYCQDTLITNPLDSLKALFDGDHSLSSKYQLAFSHLKSGEYPAINPVLTEILSNYSLSKAELAQHQAFASLFNLLVQLDSINLFPWFINSAQAFLLNEISLNDTLLPGVLARNLLIAAGEKDHTEQLVFPEDSLKTILVEDNRNGKLNASGIECSIRIYPNPAEDYFIIEYMMNSPEPVSHPTIEIFTVQGKIQETIPLSKGYDQIIRRCEHYPSGAFFCVLKNGGRQVASSTFIISK